MIILIKSLFTKRVMTEYIKSWLYYEKKSLFTKRVMTEYIRVDYIKRRKVSLQREL